MKKKLKKEFPPQKTKIKVIRHFPKIFRIFNNFKNFSIFVVILNFRLRTLFPFKILLIKTLEKPEYMKQI